MEWGETHTEWVCKNCDDEPHLLTDEFKEHIRTVHKIKKGTEGTRKMLIHLDGQDYWRSTYEWTFEGLNFLQLILGRRAEDDMMRYA